MNYASGETILAHKDRVVVSPVPAQCFEHPGPYSFVDLFVFLDSVGLDLE